MKVRGAVTWAAASVTAIAVLGVGWWGRDAMRQRAVVVNAVPPGPVSATKEMATEIARAEKVARGWSKPVQGLADLSRLYHANGFSHEAIACYDGLEKIEPTRALWPHLRANVLAGFGQLDEALPLEERSVALAPEYLPAALRLADIQLKNNQVGAAERTYAGVLQRAPDNPYAALGLAKCDVGAGRWSDARERLRSSLSRTPDFVGTLSLAVTVAEHFGESAMADTLRSKIGKREYVDFSDPWVEELAASCCDPYRLSVAASAAVAAGDIAAAHRWLERAVWLDPTAGAYHRQLGKLFFQTHDAMHAREETESAVRLTPTDSDAWLLLIEILDTAHEVGAANRTLADGLKNCPESPALHYTAGHRLSEAGRFNEAIVELKRAQVLRPNEVNAGIDLAMIYFRAERIDDAVAELKAVLAIQPGHPLAMEVLARHAIGSNDAIAARAWLRELRLQPRVPPEDLKAILAEYQQQFGSSPPP